MKKTFLISMLLALVVGGFAQRSYYDFSLVVESGQTLYFKVENDHEVNVTCPCYPGNNTYYEGFEKPSGDLVIPSVVTYGDTDYAVTKIGQGAFMECTDLTSLVLPDTLRYLSRCAFWGCTGISGEVVIPHRVSTIPAEAFLGCTGINSVAWEGDLNSIGPAAFKGCTSLEHVSAFLPDLMGVSEQAFDSCVNLSGTLTFSCGMVDRRSFRYCNIDTLIVSEGVQMIRTESFGDCHSLKTATLPASLQYICEGAFSNCGLTSLTCKAVVPPFAINEYAVGEIEVFSGVDPGIPVYVPVGSAEAYRNAEAWNYFTNYIEFGTELNGEWYYEILDKEGNFTYQYLQCVGDTVIDGKRSKIVVRTNQIFDKGQKPQSTHEYLFMNNDTLYWWNKDLQEFTILYDYSAELGDEWEIKVGHESLVMHVDAVEDYEDGGEIFRVLHVSDPENLFSGDIVCGIGHLTSFFPEKLMDHGKAFRVEGLRCYWNNGEPVFTYNDHDCDMVYIAHHNDVVEPVVEDFQVYPNPTNTVIIVMPLLPTFPSCEYRITNLLGQTVLSGTSLRGGTTKQSNLTIDVSSLPAGLYFITLGDQTLKFTKQ